jgi:hypothetical protein
MMAPNLCTSGIFMNSHGTKYEGTERLGSPEMGCEVQVVKSSFQEDLDKAGMTAGQYAEATATCKAKEVCQTRPDAALVIAGDTVRP